MRSDRLALVVGGSPIPCAPSAVERLTCSTLVDLAVKETLLGRRCEQLWQNIVRFADFQLAYGISVQP